MENWLNGFGLKGLYEVSDAGNVRRKHTGYVLIGGVSNGFRTVCLSLHGENVTRYVHILVAETFIRPRRQGEQVLFRNGDKADCSVDNLVFGTAASVKKNPARRRRPPQVVCGLGVQKRLALKSRYNGKNLKALGTEYRLSNKEVLRVLASRTE